MSIENSPSQQPEIETIKKIPVSELLRRAGEAFDKVHDEYTRTRNHKVLIEKMKLLNEIIDDCEKHGDDWDKHKEKILPRIHGLNREMANLMEHGRFATCSDRVGYGHGSEDRNINVFYELANICSTGDSDSLPEIES